MTDNICELNVSPVLVKVLGEAGITKISALQKLAEKDLRNMAGKRNPDILIKAANMVLKIYRSQKNCAKNAKKLEDALREQEQKKNISSLKLPYHTEMWLRKAGINTISLLEEKTESELLKIHALGRKEVKMVLQKLKNRKEAKKQKTIIAKKNQRKGNSKKTKISVSEYKINVPEYQDIISAESPCDDYFLFDGVKCTMYVNPVGRCERLKKA